MNAINDLLIKRIHELSSPLDPLPTGQRERIKPLPGIRAVLFDVYGTLFVSGAGDIGVNESADNSDAFIQAVTSAGFEWTGQDRETIQGPERLKACIQETHARKKQEEIEYPEVDIIEEWKRTIRGLIGGNLLTGAVSEERLKRLALEYELRVNPVWPMPGMKKVLTNLHQSGIRLGIISNAQFFTPLLFAAFTDGMPEDTIFEKLLCIWSYKEGHGKPSERLFEKARQCLREHYQIKPSETLYLGNDMRNDIGPAAQAGFRTALFAGDRRSLRLREDTPLCNALSPDRILIRLDRLFEMIGYTNFFSRETV